MKKDKKPYDASLPPVRAVYFAIVQLLRLVAVFLLRGKISKDPAIKDLAGPVIAIGNHPSFLDPVYMALVFWPRYVHFVTSSTFYRIGFFRRLLQASGTIPKVQFRTDTQAVKHMLRVLRKQGVLGIYPEGQRSFDGSLNTLDNTLPRFIKKMGCAIVVIKVHGAYLSWPRWSESWLRPGRVMVESQVLLRKEDVAAMHEQAISDCIYEALDYNDYTWQKDHQIKYLSPAPASGLHNLCHKCPACGKHLVMHARFANITCSACGFSMKMDRQGFLHPVQHGDQASYLPQSPYDWHRWQIDEMIKDFKQNGCTVKQPAEVRVAHPETGTFQKLSRGDLVFCEQGLLFNSYTDEPACDKRFPVLNRGGVTADFGTYFELVLADEVYRFLPDNGQSVILIADAIYAFQQLNQDRSDQVQ